LIVLIFLVESDPNWRHFTLVSQQPIDMADLQPGSWYLLNNVVNIVQDANYPVGSIGQLLELSSSAGRESRTEKPHIGMERKMDCTNSLVVSSFGSVERHLQLIADNLICLLHSLPYSPGVFVRILVGGFGTIQEQIDAHSWFP
jgi:hypothetical protein